MAALPDSFLFCAGIQKKNARIVLVKTEWNSLITDVLEEGCRDELLKLGAKDIRCLTVPGAFELPFAIRNYWKKKRKKDRPDAFIALGCVIRGDTPHFEYICKAATDGILSLNLSLPVPVIFAVLTVHNESQARERIGGANGHKGREAALTAAKMINMVNSKQ